MLRLSLLIESRTDLISSLKTLVLLIFASIIVGGCQRADEPQTGSIGDSNNQRALEIERLRSLPYAGWSRKEATGNSGVKYNPELSWPGYNLYVNRDQCEAILIDAGGNVVNLWRDDVNGWYWSHCQLLSNGDLFVVGAENAHGQVKLDPTAGHYLLRLSWDGKTIFKKNISAHHDIEILDDGRILTLLERYIDIPEYRKGVKIINAYVAILSAEADVLEEVSLYDLFMKNSGVLVMQNKDTINREVGPVVDLFHPNSVELLNPSFQLKKENEFYRGDKILICVREHDTVIIIDWDTKKLVWWWGPGELMSPHCATLLDNGNILIFDNGLGREYSRVVEVNPLSRNIVWEYQGDPPQSFYSRHRGANQRFPNGNTLISNSDNGQAFEVTQTGQVVWEWKNPLLNDKNQRATIVRMQRLNLLYVNTIIRRHSSSYTHNIQKK